MPIVMEMLAGSPPLAGDRFDTYSETVDAAVPDDVTATHFEAVAPGCRFDAVNRADPVMAFVPELLFCSTTVPADQVFPVFVVLLVKTAYEGVMTRPVQSSATGSASQATMRRFRGDGPRHLP